MIAGPCGFTLSRVGRVPANAARSNQYLLARLLLGNVDVARGGRAFTQPSDLSLLPASPQGKTGSQAFRDYLTDYGIGGGVTRFVKVTTADNRAFYGEIFLEFLWFFFHSKNACETAAFVHLYRILEHIAYAVPMLYASTHKDYLKTFQEFKGMLLNKDDDELALFKKFIQGGRFIDNAELDIAQRIHFPDLKTFEVVRSRVKQDKLIAADANLLFIEVQFRALMDILVTVRNRFFHAKLGGWMENIKASDLESTENLFASINPVLSSFLAIIALESVAHTYRA